MKWMDTREVLLHAYRIICRIAECEVRSLTIVHGMRPRGNSLRVLEIVFPNSV